MKSYTRSHLTDHGLLSEFTTRLSLVRDTTAELLADLAEMEERRLYVRAAYTSMHLYCVHEFHMSEETAFKRMRAARAARKFPVLYPALADGRLHLTAVVLLAPHLTPETVGELLDAASHKTKAEIELLLAERFPRPDVPTKVRAIVPADETGLELSPGTVVPSSRPKPPARREPVPELSKSAPLSAERFEWHLTVSKSVQEKLRHAQELLGHAVPSGNLPVVLERALDALVEKLERQKFAKTARPRPQKGPVKGRHVPAAVKRAVLERDSGQCTFVSEQGKRCESRTRLEWDHVEPVARGGQATPDNLRLRCRAHNQYAAERTFGHEFMRAKREQSRASAARAKARARADAEARAREEAASERDVIPWLRELGYNAARARKGADACAHIPEAPLEERLKVALRALAPHCVRWTPQAASAPA
jgi:5-methylcytosine-specific restriction endonuclease McrA